MPKHAPIMKLIESLRTADNNVFEERARRRRSMCAGDHA
jgi:hypothetical protein